MSQRLLSFPERSAIKRTPLEVWESILRIAVSNPLEHEKQDTVPYTYVLEMRRHTCQYHLSEVTRYRLRLVCFLWNEILLPFQDRLVLFFPYSHWPPIHDWGRVRHIVFMEGTGPFCPKCEAINLKNHGIRYLGKTPEPDYFSFNAGAAAHSFLNFVDINNLETLLSPSRSYIPIRFPAGRLRILSGVTLSSPIGFIPTLASISSGFENLRELTIPGYWDHPFRFTEALNHRHLNTLILSFHVGTLRPEPVGETKRWILPSLKSLVIQARPDVFSKEDFRTFIRQFTSSLTFLSFSAMYSSDNAIQALNESWDDVPNLCKLEATTGNLVELSRPPDGHPPITLILGDLRVKYSLFDLGKAKQLCDKLQNEWKGWPIESVLIPCSWDDLRRNIVGVRDHFGMLYVAQIPSGLDILSHAGVPLLDCFGSSASSVEGLRCLQSLRNLRDHVRDTKDDH